jgi:hypothetical protein
MMVLVKKNGWLAMAIHTLTKKDVLTVLTNRGTVLSTDNYQGGCQGKDRSNNGGFHRRLVCIQFVNNILLNG